MKDGWRFNDPWVGMYVSSVPVEEKKNEQFLKSKRSQGDAQTVLYICCIILYICMHNVYLGMFTRKQWLKALDLYFII